MWLPEHSVRDQHRPGTIHHYTTTEGLMGIIESDEFWATDLNYMNDTSELSYARHLIANVLEDLRADVVAGPVQILYERAARILEPSYRMYYGVCFCEESDLLSQWRAYGARGGGFAVGLQADEIGLRSDVPLCVRKVIYDPDQQRRLVEATLTRTGELLLRLAPEPEPANAEQVVPIIAHFLDDHLAEFTFIFKNPAFREEKEWRVILPILPYEVNDAWRHARFRNSGGMLVPFVSLKVGPAVGPNAGRLPLARIVLGPTVDPKLTKDAVDGLLRKYEFNRVEILSSAIPLRA